MEANKKYVTTRDQLIAVVQLGVVRWVLGRGREGGIKSEGEVKWERLRPPPFHKRISENTTKKIRVGREN